MIRPFHLYLYGADAGPLPISIVPTLAPGRLIR